MTRTTDLAFLSALELATQFRTKAVSPVEAAQAGLDQIEQHEGTLNAFCLVDAERALKDARASEARYQRGEPLGPLDGVPVAVKDVFLTKGWPTLRGSMLSDAGGPWEIDAPVVASLRRGGAVMLGKTTTPELGWKGVTDSPRHGITRNPWNPAMTPGGSSGGSAVAVAMGMSTLALGTDGGGSIRIPASFSGVSGFKPTYGRVPLWPVSPYGTLAHAGPMARTVEELALMLNVLAEPDPRDWTMLAPDGLDYLNGLDGGVKGLRVAASPDLGYVELHEDVRAAFEAAVRVFSELGAEVEERAPGFDDPRPTYEVLWNVGAAYATRTATPDQRAQMDRGLQEITAEALTYSVLDPQQAASGRGELGVRMGLFHEDFDLLLTPTMPIPAFTAGLEVPEGWPHRRWASWSPFTYPFNLTQQPAASVPCGFTREGLPIGLQIIGARHQDALVLHAAHAFQQATDHLHRPQSART